jgi:hypothetical protein
MSTVLALVAGGAAGFLTAYTKERASWGSKARKELLKATGDALAVTQDAKEGLLALCKAQSREEADAYIDAVRQCPKSMANAHAQVIVFTGPKSGAVDALEAIKTRLHVAADIVGVGRSSALEHGDEAAADQAADSIGEQIDILDEEVSDFAAAIYLAAEIPILKRRWEAYKERKRAKERARSIGSRT